MKQADVLEKIIMIHVVENQVSMYYSHTMTHTKNYAL